MIAKLIIIPVAVVVVGVLFLPTLVRLGTRALSSSEEIILSTGADSFESDAEGRAVQLVTLLGFDAIRAILDPSFVTAAEAQDWRTRTSRCSACRSTASIAHIPFRC